MSDDHGPAQSVNGWNADYIQGLYQQYKDNPNSLEENWRAFFQGFELAQELAPSISGGSSASPSAQSSSDEQLQSHVDSLIYHYRDVGHLKAKIDPLGKRLLSDVLLNLQNFELSDDDLDKEFHTKHLWFGQDRMKLRDVISTLEETYCGSIGVEYMDIQNTAERRWLQNRMESTRNKAPLDSDKKLRIARFLRKAHAFEAFIQTNYIGQKRFSLEGAETVIPLLDSIINKCPSEGVDQIVMGMAHRGRLNVLANILNKSYEEIFSEFEDNHIPNTIMGDGDVKYHKGASHDYKTSDGNQVHLSLSANPSHLEAVDAVVLGRVRAKQRNCGDVERKRVMGLLIHGDAAFAGQGIVAETLNLSQLAGYRTGGTVHVIINNQIGFTTLPEDARSGDYSTDVAKMIQAPIFHVNGDDPEACVRVAEIALEYLQIFQKDVVIDMYCYRRHGHNEGDEPSFTQPKMYDQIRNHPSPLEIYNQQLIEDGVVTEEELNQIAADHHKEMEDAQNVAHNSKVESTNIPFKEEWEGFQESFSFDQANTAVEKSVLMEIADCWTRYPEDFTPNRKIKGIMDRRTKMVRDGEAIDWGAAEALAIGSLLVENIPVRLSGQDSRRGTFSHRHAVLWDANTAEKLMPMSFIREQQARFCAYDSCLSEAAVLGFDYGYSLDNPDMLICWEAQFGDFANGAQTIIDQFIATSESKWSRVSGLVMLLPHGYEGQGPEHSSGWLERFLQLCAEENIQVCNVSTPAQYFHLLRRQIHRKFRKPLILMTPKSGLRHPSWVSPITDFTDASFVEVLDDASANAKKVQKVIFCSGKVYYDLEERRQKEKNDQVAIIRIEQLYPFASHLVEAILKKYKHASEFIWCQEETQNKGAWSFIDPMFREQFGLDLTFVGRERAASPAVGSLRLHKMEQEELVAEALTLVEQKSNSQKKTAAAAASK